MSVQSFRLPNGTALAKARATKLFEDLQRRFQNKELLTHDDVRSAAYEMMREAFLHAGEPTFTGAELPAHYPRLREHYADPIRKIANDLAVAYKEAKALSGTMTASFNLQQALFDMLDGKAKRVGSTLLDLQIANAEFLGPVIVAGDDFTDASRLDPDTPLGLPRADVNPLGNTLTLRRLGNNSVINPERARVVVQPLQSYRERLYEGQFYGLIGQAVPEGGVFNFERGSAVDALRSALPVDLLARYRNYVETGVATGATSAGQSGTQNTAATPAQGAEQARSGGSFGGFSLQEWELLASNIHSGTELDTILPGVPAIFKSAVNGAINFIDKGAPVDVRNFMRQAMIDGDPDTFWQIEYTRQINPSGFDALREGDENYPERVGILSGLLRERDRSFDALDLDVRIIVDLGAVQTANWIDLVPMLFDGIQHLQILKIQSSTDNEEFEDIPAFRSGEGGSRIGKDTNTTLEDRVAALVQPIAPNSSAFGGRGLWIFAPRPMRYLRIDLRQPVPVLSPYQLLKLTLQRTVRRRHSRNSFGHRRPSTQSTETRQLLLSYPETIEATVGFGDPAVVAGARGAARIDPRDRFADLAAGGGVNLSNVRGAIHDLVGNALGRPHRGRTLYGNETVTNQEVVTKWDQQRYAIGIRDIGIWRYEFAEQSEMISIPFRSPQPIRSLSLEVDEVVPIQFNEGGDIRSWINYYVAIGDSQDWQPIAPTSERVVRALEGGQVPAVIHINAGIPIAERNPGEGYIDTDAPVFQVRFRAVLSRPTNLQDAASFTPALKAYRLLMTTTGGER